MEEVAPAVGEMLGRWARQAAAMWGSRAKLEERVARLPALLRLLTPALRARLAFRVALLAYAAHYILVQGARGRLTMAPAVRASLLRRNGKAPAPPSSSPPAESKEEEDADEEKPRRPSAAAERVAEIVARSRRLHTRYWPTLANSGLLQTALADVHTDRLPLPRGVLRALGFEPVAVARREEISTKDGGRVCVDYMANTASSGGLPRDAPLLLIFPGNLGGSDAPYVQSLLRSVAARRPGWRTAVYVRRGCGSNGLRTVRPQNVADEDDLEAVLAHLEEEWDGAPVVACGFSLGANFLVRHLGLAGRRGRRTPILGAVSLGNPWNLTGLSYYLRLSAPVVQWALMASMRRVIAESRGVLDRGEELSVRTERLLRCATYRELYKRYHLQVHGEPGQLLDEFLLAASSFQFAGDVRVPLLAVGADDDPVCPPALTPHEVFARNEHTVLCETRHGGHHAFLGPSLWSERWSDHVAIEFLDGVLATEY